ncbi:MAG TPA: sugar ABC transporter substrate-binding protein [Chthoniobacterales bacterium]|nr:sugar ABC transporter substrate-binding protein [Chthoniobacterales bacterium]
MKTKLITALAVLGSLLLPIAGFAQKKPHIIVVTHGQVSDSFWLVVKNGVDQAAKDSGAQVDYRSPEKFDMVAMSQLIDAAVASKPDGLVVSIPDADALSKAIQAAVKAGIPVISMNSGSDVSKKLGCLMHVGQEEYVAGKGAGERMKAEGVTKAVCLNQEVGNAGLDARAKGFKDGLGGDVEVLAVSMDFTQTRNAFAGYLQKNPDVQAILALGPTGAEPALQALEQAGKAGKVKFGTFDLSPTVLQALSKGEMDFAIDQQQFLQGYLPVIFLANYVKYGLLIATDSVPTGPGFVTQQNAKQVIELSKQGIR